MTQNAWKNVHTATCGEPATHCHCSCAECAAGKAADAEGIVQHVQPQPLPEPTQTYAMPPMTPEGSRPVHSAIQPQAATMNGIPGTWIPSPHSVMSPDSAGKAAVPSNSPGANVVFPDQYTSRAEPQLQIPADQTHWPMTPPSAVNPPAAVPPDDLLKEYRTQVQVLSEQIAQMKDSQESIRANQESLKESHAREILELKLQQTTAERDRLQRERELEQQLEAQRQRELETIDSLSEIVEGVMPRSASSPPPARIPQSVPQIGQGQANSPQELPTVDGSL